MCCPISPSYRALTSLQQRPNEAKVKNLKTKDYLGKARLIATSNTSNTSTGFTGADRKQAIERQIIGTDDRLPENISYAATNLVQRNLSSRHVRDHSAPPVMGRNIFPPTPPPEHEKPAKHSSTPTNSLPLRTSSMRHADRRPQLAPYRSDSELSASESEQRRPRVGVPPQLAALADAKPSQSEQQNGTSRPRPSRTASEPRGPPSRNIYQRQASSRGQAPLYGETTNLSDADTVDEVYRLYQPQQPTFSSSQNNASNIRRPGSARQTAMRQEPYIDEEAEYYHEPQSLNRQNSDASSFEIMGNPYSNLHNNYNIVSSNSTSRSHNSGSRQRPPLPHQSSSTPATGNATTFTNAATEPSRGSLGGLSKIRVKVHANDDTRYIMIGPTIEYGDLESRVREKFGIKSRLRIKMEDDGDMITMADQEDLEMLLGTVRNWARKEKNEMGKMEVSRLV